MRVKVGYWKTGMAVHLDDEARDWLKTQGRALCAQVQVDRRILLTAGPRGASIRAITQNEAAHKPVGFSAWAESLPPYLEFMAGPDFELPLFELHELAVDYDYALDGLLTEPLAPDFELPWPRHKHARNRMSAEELQRQCYLRAKAHMLTGGHGMFDEVGVPREVVRTMGGGFRLAHQKARLHVHGASEEAA